MTSSGDKLRRNGIRLQCLLYYMIYKYGFCSILLYRPFSISKECALRRNLLIIDLSALDLHRSIYGDLLKGVNILDKNDSFSLEESDAIKFCLN